MVPDKQQKVEICIMNSMIVLKLLSDSLLSCQKLDVILKNKVVYELKISKNVTNKKCDSKLILFNEKELERFG